MSLLFFILLIVVTVGWWFLYYKFFRNAKPIDAQGLNDIQFGRTIDYTMPVEEDRSKELIIEPPKDHGFDDWHKEKK